jgi:phospholipid/cholesterol/gamma-HCH transport system permease protein
VHLDLGDVSRAAWGSVHWGTQTVADNLESLLKVVAFTLCVGVVSCYYGYRARGGAVGVGVATAKSMLVNLVLVNVLNAIGSALFFAHPRLPIGG